MADIEDNTASARAKRPAGIASAAGRRERRAPASKVRAASVNIKPPVFVPALSPRDSDCERRRRRARDARDADDSPPPFPTLRAIAQDLDIEHVKPTRRAAASAAAAEHSSDHSEDTGIEGTDAPENATARPASRGKAAPRKGGPVPDAKAASSECDEDSAAATPKHAKVEDFVTPKQFAAYGSIARAKGFLQVASSPLTRSSYHAGDDFAEMRAAREAKLAKQGA